jgi:hypothetical protein
MSEEHLKLVQEWLDANVPGHISASTEGYATSLAALLDRVTAEERTKREECQAVIQRGLYAACKRILTLEAAFLEAGAWHDRQHASWRKTDPLRPPCDCAVAETLRRVMEEES